MLDKMRCSPLLLAVVLWPALVAAQGMSLKEIARAHGGKASSSSDVDLPSASLPEFVQEADYIVEARILTKRGVLSSDETMVRTQYEILPLRVFKDPLNTAVRPTIGSGMRLVISQPGGRMTIDGLHLESTNNLFPVEGLKVGNTFIMFLRHDVADGVFQFLRGPYGVYAVEGNSVLPSTRTAALSPVPFEHKDQLYAEITRLVENSKRQSR
jgi:hypothetical protein